MSRLTKAIQYRRCTLPLDGGVYEVLLAEGAGNALNVDNVCACVRVRGPVFCFFSFLVSFEKVLVGDGAYFSRTAERRTSEEPGFGESN